jgi:hypothetical protein
MRAALLSMLLVLTVLSYAQSGAIIVQMTASDTDVVVGEPVIISIKAFDPDRVAGIQLIPPPLSDFGQDHQTDIAVSTDIINGIPQFVYQQQITLYPHRSGTFVIPPAQVRTPETPLTPEQFFESSPLVVNVRPLPLPSPAAFTNAVGTFAVSTQVDRTTIGANESLQLRLAIVGDGNLPVIRPSELYLNSGDWRALPPQRALAPDRKHLSFTWTLIPRRSGQLEVSTPPFAWYDPTKLAYQTLAPRAVQITVGLGLPEASDSPSSLPAAPHLTLDGPPAAMPIDVNADLLRAAVPKIWPDITLWLIPPAVSLSVFIVSRLSKRPQPVRRRRAAPTDLRSKLVHAVQLPPVQAFPLLEAALQHGLQRYQPPDQDLDTWLHSLPVPLSTRILRLRQDLSDARYAPASAEDVREWARSVILVLRQLEAFLERS